MVKLSYRNGVFYCATDFASRRVPEAVGFTFIDNKWQTDSHHIAARLRAHADPWTEKYFQRLEIRVSPWPGRIPWPETLMPLKHQVEAASFALSRSASYIAADPGTGKSIMAALMINALEEKGEEYLPPLIVYVCPPHLVLNAQEEFAKWRVPEWEAQRYSVPGTMNHYGVWIVPDNRLARVEVASDIRYAVGKAKREGSPVVFIVDEAHRFKNDDSNRGSALLSVTGGAVDQIVWMSGTALPNARPIELFPILARSAPEVIEFRNKIEFGLRYCEAFEHKSSFGSEWKFPGAANTEELFSRLKQKFMLRVPKSVLGLKGKIEEIIVLEDDMPAKLLPMERAILHHYSVDDLCESRFLRERGQDPEEAALHVSDYQHLIGLAKLKPFWEYFRAFLDDNPDEPVLVFAKHTEVVERLRALVRKAGYGEPYSITGKTPMPVRHEMVRKFQAGKNRIFILQRDAGGEGITLTRAKRVMLLEPSWVDGQNTQCIDRADRYGQTEMVLGQYFVYRNSLDKQVVTRAIEKRAITNNL